MSWHSAGALCCEIMVDAVACTLAEQHAAMRFQVANQINALHKSSYEDRDFFAGNCFSAM